MGGLNALRETYCRVPTTWNRILDNIRQIVIELSLEHPELAPSKLSFFIGRESDICFRVKLLSYFARKKSIGNVWGMILSLQLMNSIIRQNSPMRCGRPILPISKSRVEAGIISLR